MSEQYEQLLRGIPRYTSYPPATAFYEPATPSDLLAQAAAQFNPRDDLSFYIHIPFCRSLCYYCGCNKTVTRSNDLVNRYLAALKKEIEAKADLFKHQGRITQLHFGGGTPTFLSAEQIGDILYWVKSRFNLDFSQPGDYSIEVDPRTADRKKIFALAALGFNRISFGIQDINPHVQEAIHRIQPIEMNTRVIQAAKDAGFSSINLDILYGLPEQGLNDLANTVEQVIKWAPDRVALFPYAHLPKRFPSQRLIATNRLADTDLRTSMFEQAQVQLCNADFMQVGQDHFAKAHDTMAVAAQNNQLHRNFQGYTHVKADNVLAVGASAISSIGHVYAQNVVDAKAYIAALETEHGSCYRGYPLTQDDIIRSRVIGDLMCRGELHIQDIESAFDISFIEYFAEPLKRLEHYKTAGIVAIDSRMIKLMPDSVHLGRIVCATFDRYLSPEALNVTAAVAQEEVGRRNALKETS